MKGSISYIGLALLLAACGPRAAVPDSPPAALPPASLEADTLHTRRGRLEAELFVTARVVALRQAPLSFQQGGQLRSLDMAEGRRVQAGQLLAALDTAALRLEWEQAQNRLEKARIERQGLRLQYHRADSDSLSAAQQRYIDIASGYREALTQLRMLEERLRQARLRAPFAGYLSDLKAKAFQQVAPGQELATLTDPGSIRIRAGMLERELPALRAGMAASVSVPALPGAVFNAFVEDINPSVDDKGLIYVNLRPAQPDARLFPGMYAELRIRVPAAETQVLAPAAALLERSGRAVVFSWVNGFAKWNYVRSGARNAGWVEILEGLEAGQPVLVSGHFNAGHDMRVQLRPGNASGRP